MTTVDKTGQDRIKIKGRTHVPVFPERCSLVELIISREVPKSESMARCLVVFSSAFITVVVQKVIHQFSFIPSKQHVPRLQVKV